MSGRLRVPYDSTDPRWWGINEDGTPDETKLSEIVDAIVRAARPERIILFGSAATGTMNERSDLDLLVVMDTATPRREAQRLMSATPPQSPPLDLLVARREDVERTRHDPLFVTYDACRHGRVVYDGRE